jgi:hypothetical protein
MTKRDILSVAFKIMGVLFAANAIMYVPWTLMALLNLAENRPTRVHEALNVSLYWSWAAALAAPILMFCIGYVLLTLAEPIADRLARGDTEVLSLGLGPRWEQAIFSVSMRIVGVLLLARGIPDLVSWRLFFRPWFIQRPIDVRGLLFDLIRPLLTLIIGAYLLTGARHLLRFLFREPPATTQPGPMP